jgi:taurine dioxygenase
MEITRLNGALGARVAGIDWDGGLTDGDFDAVESALAAHGVLAIEAARMRPEQHVELARHFGELEHHEFFANQGEGVEHITVLDSERGDRSNMWHIDEQFLEKPPVITMTHAIQLPDYGGDTSFISLHAAYDGLSPRMQQYLDGLHAVHDLARIAEMAWQGGHGGPEHLADELRKGKQASHPVVLVHPQSGRRALYVSPTYTRFIEGLPMPESKAVLDFLYLHVQRPEFGYRHRWQEGDLLMWDNRAVMHHAAADYDQRRVMHRISVIGPA